MDWVEISVENQKKDDISLRNGTKCNILVEKCTGGGSVKGD